MSIKGTLLKIASSIVKKEVQPAASWPPICPSWLTYQLKRPAQLKVTEDTEGQVIRAKY